MLVSDLLSLPGRYFQLINFLQKWCILYTEYLGYLWSLLIYLSTTLTFPLLCQEVSSAVLFKVTINYFFLRNSRVILE